MTDEIDNVNDRLERPTIETLLGFMLGTSGGFLLPGASSLLEEAISAGVLILGVVFSAKGMGDYTNIVKGAYNRDNTKDEK